MRFDSCDYRPRSMCLRASIAIAALATLAGCGGGGGDGDDDGGQTGPGMSISSGNNQTVAQYLRGKLAVRIVDSANHPVYGTVVTFSAPGLTTDPMHSTATTDGDGVATFYGSFHKTGNIQVTASASGLTSATFYITVTQNPYKFDGYYDCAGRGTNGGPDVYYLHVEGTLVTTDNGLTGLRDVVYDPVGGSLVAKQRQGLDFVGHWTAMFAVDSAGVGTLTGTDESWHLDIEPVPGTPARLDCTRQ